MAVDFVEKKKKQRYLVFVVIGILAVSAVILWFGYFRTPKEEVSQEPVFIVKKNIRINFGLLESPLMKALVLFEKTPDYEGDLGRENPFSQP